MNRVYFRHLPSYTSLAQLVMEKERQREINDGETLLISTQPEKRLGHPLELFLEIPEQQNSGEKNSPSLFTQRDLFCVRNTVFFRYRLS